LEPSGVLRHTSFLENQPWHTVEVKETPKWLFRTERHIKASAYPLIPSLAIVHLDRQHDLVCESYIENGKIHILADSCQVAEKENTTTFFYRKNDPIL
jgi:hypothetical protein